MLKIEHKYENYAGEESERVLYFNMTEKELADFALEFDGDIEVLVKEWLAVGDAKSIMRFFELLILSAYGERDGDEYFIKTEAVVEKFKSSAAYQALYYNIVTDPDKAAWFFNKLAGVTPGEIESKKKDAQEALKSRMEIDRSRRN